jgi:MFS transporter, FSR family, fosmidomycin resistance protein
MKSMTCAEAAEISRSNEVLVLAAETGALHALVDCACGAVIYRQVSAAHLPPEVLLFYVLAYDALAFGLQWVLGFLADLRGAHRALAAGGAWLTAAAVMAGSVSPWTGAILAGVGNAGFHVGAAGALLPRCEGRALAPGIFVGPGALGIFVGVWMGAHVLGWQGLMAVLLAAAGFRLWFLLPREPVRRSSCAETARVPWGIAIVAALFVSVVIRSVVAGVLAAAWWSPVLAGLTLAVAAGCGKCLGGWLADRFGWRRTATLALAASAPLLFAGTHYFPLAVCGMLLFQSTMPVTLAGTYALMPHRPGFAFGLPSLALLLGALPGFTPWLRLHPALVNSLLMPVILASAALLWLGLGWGRLGPGLSEASRLATSHVSMKRCNL